MSFLDDISAAGIDAPKQDSSFAGDVGNILPPKQKEIPPITSPEITQPKSFGDKLIDMWQNPPPQPSLIHTAKDIYGMFSGALGAYPAAKELQALPEPTREEDYPAYRQKQQELQEKEISGAAQAAMLMGPTSIARGTGLPLAQAARAASPPTQSSLMSAAGDLGLGVPRILATESPAVQQFGAALKSVPFAGTPIYKSVRNFMDELGEKGQDILSQYTQKASSATDKDTLRYLSGEAAKDSIKDWIAGEDGAEAVAKRVYGKVNNYISSLYEKSNPETRDELFHSVPSNTQDIIAQISKELYESGTPVSGDLTRVLDSIQRPGGMTYSGLKDLRTWVGRKIDDRLEPTDAPLYKRLYGPLTKDIEDNLRQVSGDTGVKLWQKADSVYGQIRDRQSALAKIVGLSGNVSAEDVAQRLIAKAQSKARPDIEGLSLARKTIGPDAWNDIAGATISRMITGKEGEFSPATFVTEYGKLTPAGKNMLFRSTGRGDLADNLDKIYTVSKEIGDRHTKFLNPSGTARSAIGFAELGGLWAAPMTTLGTIVSARAISHLLANPKTSKAVADWAQAYRNAGFRPTAADMDKYQRSTAALKAISSDYFGEEAPQQ